METILCDMLVLPASPNGMQSLFDRKPHKFSASKLINHCDVYEIDFATLCCKLVGGIPANFLEHGLVNAVQRNKETLLSLLEDQS